MVTLYGILGSPVAHSRSPAMHNAAFRALGIDATYVAFEVAPARLADAVRGLAALGVGGVNVTVPHKEHVIDLLDEVSDAARAIGAVNTVVQRDGRLLGHNTDAPGLVRSLEDAKVPLRDARVVVLGAGGAARASVVGLARAGARQIVVAARRIEQAEALTERLSAGCPDTRLSVCAMAHDALSQAFKEATLLVQSTSATLAGQPGADAFAARLPWHALAPDARVVDLVYKPRETSVLQAARQRGLATVDGLGMLLHQGTRAFELWTGRPAPVSDMRAALEAM